LIAILGISALLIWGWNRIENMDYVPDLARGYAYPAIISIGLYLAAVLQCALIGLGSIGKEGRRFWILRSMPVTGRKIFNAKAFAILSFSPITVAGVALPLPLILGYSWWWVLFFVLSAIALILTFTGIGLILGAFYPNFDESRGGMPDIMSMYLTMIMCLVFGAFMITIPGFNMRSNVLGGLGMCIIMIEVGAIVLLAAIRIGAWHYERIEPAV
jgi:hypothetical protein